MGKQPFISHTVNGYSRYDVPESKAFSCTPGPLYPVRIDYINARDRVTIAQGIDVRSNPLAVPTFNPYTIRLHRFWVPLQLYHPEMRTNSSKFDMNSLSLNWIPVNYDANSDGLSNLRSASYSNSLMSWLRIGLRMPNDAIFSDELSVELPDDTPRYGWANADSYLAYWDIVRNFYSYSQWSLFSIAWPASWSIVSDSAGNPSFQYASTARFFKQAFCNLEFLDAFFESQFYPGSVNSSDNSFNRYNLFNQLIASQVDPGSDAETSDGFPVAGYRNNSGGTTAPEGQFSIKGSEQKAWTLSDAFYLAHPLAVVPSSPDRYSRLLPVTESDSVSMTGIESIPQLAVASRLQEYKDLLGAGGSRYSDFLETFFASKIEHVDRPKLLFSASQTVNVQVVMNQAGNNNFSDQASPLGAQGGSIAFNSKLGGSQTYYFREPGYMFDMLSIRPVYYWAQIRPDYLSYMGADYFNPIYNDIGYQDVPLTNFAAGTIDYSPAKEPCFNEFRSSYDEVLGQINAAFGAVDGKNLYAYWVQQRTISETVVTTPQLAARSYYPLLFVDMEQVNSPFASDVEDNFFVNISYSVRKKNLVNKTFATRLSNR